VNKKPPINQSKVKNFVNLRYEIGANIKCTAVNEDNTNQLNTE